MYSPRVCRLMDPIVEAAPERWPDDRPNSEFIPGVWPDWGDFKKARAALDAYLASDEHTIDHQSAAASALGFQGLAGKAEPK
jgi:hypothetical protein